MSYRFSRPFIPVIALLSFLVPAHAAKNRVFGPIDNNHKIALKGSRRPAQTLAEADYGRVDPAMAIVYARVVLQPLAEQSAALDQFLEEQRDPSSPDYQNCLTPEEFADRFSVSANDAAQVASWLQSQGFAVEGVARGRGWITFSGSASRFESAFQTEIHHFRGTGEQHFANTRPLFVPAAIADVVSEIRGLHNYRWSPPRMKRLGSVGSDYTTSATSHYLAPDDFATIYNLAPLYGAGYNGSGQKIAVVGQSDVNMTDITAFRSRFNLPASTPQVVLYGSDPGVRQGDNIESTLDLEWAGAVARNASLLFVNSSNVILSAEYAVDQNLAPVISISYGGCEALNSPGLRSVVQQANAQGITWLASSGDSGAAGCDASSSASATQGLGVNIPASIPEVTAVGGTTFNEGSATYWSSSNTANSGSVLSYIPETAWNDAALEGSLAASGGGVSTFYAKPAWQSGPGVPADGARDVPDIAGTASAAHDGYLLYVNGRLEAVGGTSAPTPAYAGVIAILNQYLLAKGSLSKAGVGNINPTLYHLAQSNGILFHDVTSGSNIVPCTVGTKNCATGSLGYSAGIGYDLVTGLGSIDANRLVTGWTGVVSSISTTTSVTANPANIQQNSSTLLTAMVKPASGTTAPTGTVTFERGSTVLGVVAVSVSGSSGVASLTIAGSSLALGGNTITAVYNGSASFSASNGAATVTVTVPANASNVTASANPNPVSGANGSWSFRLTLSNSGGPTTLTGMTINGANYSGSINSWFGSNQLAQGSSLGVNLVARGATAGTQYVFVFSGADPGGRTWSTSLTVTLK